MTKLYEHEIERTNITPKQFFTYCKKQLEKKGINLEDWVDFESWVDSFPLVTAHLNTKTGKSRNLRFAGQKLTIGICFCRNPTILSWNLISGMITRGLDIYMLWNINKPS